MEKQKADKRNLYPHYALVTCQLYSVYVPSVWVGDVDCPSVRTRLSSVAVWTRRSGRTSLGSRHLATWAQQLPRL